MAGARRGGTAPDATKQAGNDKVVLREALWRVAAKRKRRWPGGREGSDTCGAASGTEKCDDNEKRDGARGPRHRRRSRSSPLGRYRSPLARRRSPLAGAHIGIDRQRAARCGRCTATADRRATSRTQAMDRSGAPAENAT